MEFDKAAQRAEAETKLSLIVEEYMDENSLWNMIWPKPEKAKS
jgi:hypothetical protein